MIRPYLLTHALAFALAVPILWLTLALRNPPQPDDLSLARGNMHDIAYAGAMRGQSPAPGAGAKPASVSDADDRWTASREVRSWPLDDLQPADVTFDFNSTAPVLSKPDSFLRPRPLRGADDAVATPPLVTQPTNAGAPELLPPPVASALAYGFLGGYGIGGFPQGFGSTGVYTFEFGSVGGFGPGTIGWIVPPSSPGNSGDPIVVGTSGGYSDYIIGWGFKATPEPSSWLLGLCAAAALLALRVASSRSRKS